MGSKIKKIEKTTVRLPHKALELEVENDAMEILKDYVMLLMRRPFLALATVVCLNIISHPIPTIAASNLIGAFINLEAGATFYACKNNIKRVDKNAMREIISFADGCLCGQFKSPESSMH